MSTALNPFYDAYEDEEEDEEEEEEKEEDVEEVEEVMPRLPEPCRTVAEDTSQSQHYTKDKEFQISSSEKTCSEDMLELEVMQSELEEMGGTSVSDGEALKEKDGKEIVEIIEIALENNKKRKVERSKVTPVASAPSLDSEEEPTSVAKLVQFNKPSRQRSRVTSGVLEVVSGDHCGLKGVFQVGCCYVWGYHLAGANLMYHLRAGDSFTVSVGLKEGVDVEEAQVPLLVKKAWLGIKSEVPVKSADNLEFAAWLIERNITEEEFLLWLADKVPPKPFFPLKSELYEAKVVMLIRENPKGDGALVRIIKEGEMKDNLAVFERDDFYLCGVNVGEADMRFLVKPGDTVTVQLKDISERERKNRCKKFPKLDEFEFSQVCLLAYIGDERPRGPLAKPGDNPELRGFLEQKGMSIEEFERMRAVSEEREVEAPVEMTTPSSMGWLVNPPPVSLSSLPPPSPALLPPFAPSASQMEKMAKCNQLVAKAILMEGGKRQKISDLLSTEEEIQLGYFLADIFTSSLVANVQNKVKANLFNKMGSGVGEALNSMNRQLEMVKNQIIRNKPKPGEIIQVATDVAIAGSKPMSQAMAEAQQNTLAAIQVTILSLGLCLQVLSIFYYRMSTRLRRTTNNSNRPGLTSAPARGSWPCPT